MTNTAGAIPGIIGVVTTGAILDQTGSWPLALFVPSIFFFVTGVPLEQHLACLILLSHATALAAGHTPAVELQWMFIWDQF